MAKILAFVDPTQADDPNPANEDNLRWYRRHQLAAGALFWLPTVFLFLISRLGITTALQLQAVYYLAVVVAEVPSGWWSDRFGRVATLRIAALCWVAAHGLFLAEPGLAGLAGAQVLLAAGFALISGTDVTFHFEAVEALGRADEYQDREASVRRHSLYATALSAAAGGGLGLVDLRLPFLAALVAAVAQLLAATRLREPGELDQPDADDPTPDEPTRRRIDPVADLVAAFGRLRDPVLAWLAAVVVVQVIVVHLAGELTPPYLTFLLETDPTAPGRASLINGLVAAVVASVGALALHLLGPLDRRIGLRATLLVAALVPVWILGAMALVTSLVVLPLLALRGVNGAVNAVIVPGIVGGRVPSGQRATLLSMASLGGRLGYAGALGLLSLMAADGLRTALLLAAGVAALLWLVVALASMLVEDVPPTMVHDHDHAHGAMTHDHLHRHDDGHHDHTHDPPVTGPHRHPHRHPPVRHAHPHGSDLHHVHPHR